MYLSMTFIDGPSVLAPVSDWHAYLKRLSQFNQRDAAVISETERAHRIIAVLIEEEALDKAALETEALGQPATP